MSAAGLSWAAEAPFDRVVADGDALDLLCANLRQVVRVHEELMRKLLFTGKPLPLELAELLEDVANTYIGYSNEISQRWLDQPPLVEVEELPDTYVGRAVLAS